LRKIIQNTKLKIVEKKEEILNKNENLNNSMNRWTLARVAIVVIISEIDCAIMTVSRMLMWRIASLMDRVWSGDTKIPFFCKKNTKINKSLQEVSVFVHTTFYWWRWRTIFILCSLYWEIARLKIQRSINIWVCLCSLAHYTKGVDIWNAFLLDD